MTGPSGMFTRKITVHSYFDNAGGLRVGAPVRLDGVDLGNVTGITVDSNHGNGLTPVKVSMKLTMRFPDAIKKDTTSTLNTAGVLGETFVDLDSRGATKAAAQDGDELPSKASAQLQDVVRASQGTLENVDVLVRRVDRILTQIESGNGSIGRLIYDEGLYNRLNTTLVEVQRMVTMVSEGKGSVGKMINSDELYNKANATIDNLNKVIDEVNGGQGTIGKFLKDPELYNNANATIAKANTLMADINAGKGALGKFAADPEFAKKLDNTVTRLSSIADKMDSDKGTVGLLLTDPKVYNNSDQLLVEMRTLMKAIRENPKKYLTIHFKVF
jgi:phospholipid/cholesterol/gamma-HCH transport system substrate-binding protein